MMTMALIGGVALAVAASFFFFRMRAVARQLDQRCAAMMDIALSLMIVLPLGLGVLACGLFAYGKTGAPLVALAALLSFSGGLVLVPTALKDSIRQLKMTEQEREACLFD